MVYKKINYFLLSLSLIFFVSCSNNSKNFESNIHFDIENCNISSPQPTKESLKADNEIYIIGHAYGAPGKGNFFPENLVNFFSEKLDPDQINHIALTGDFVRINNIESFKRVKNYIDNNFSNYFLSVGNHEVGEEIGNLENYHENFNEVLFYQEFNEFLIISANFSNENWLPTIDYQRQINSIIDNTNKENIIILSHQLFWLEEINYEISANSDSLLSSRLNKDSLSWIRNNDKNYIVISGDYGAWGDTTYCKKINNRLFIASGIGDTENDSIIKIYDYKNSLLIKEVNINTKG